MSPNHDEYPIAFHGVCTAGAVNTTLNPLYTAEEINFQLRDSGARMLITVPPLLDKARDAVRGTAVDEIVVFGEADGATPFASLLAGEEVSQAAIDPARDLTVLLYSSGTTGVPKGVMLSHRNLVANLVQTAALSDVGDEPVFMAVLPFFHSYGMNVIMNLGLYLRGTVVSMPRFELQAFLLAIQRYRVTWVYVVPPIVVALVKSPSIGGYDLSSVQAVQS
jgi:acyl-CoA synthetase (AMP-forming)/AMP-acid ligase II